MANLKIVGLEGGAVRVVLEAQFNPKEISVGSSVPWQLQPGRGPGDLRYMGSDSPTLACELLFDGFPSGTSVQDHIDKLQQFSEVDPALRRPPKIRVVWGDEGATGALPRFEGVIEGLSIKYTMFDSDGKPLRATVNLRLREARNIVVARPAPATRRT